MALDSVVLPGGDIIRYRFGDNGMPFMVLRNHAPSEEYQWLDPLRLARFRDHRTNSDYTFHYGGDRVPEAVTVRGPALGSLDGNLLAPSIFRKAGEPAAPQRFVTFHIGCDQVGTPKVLLDPDGRMVKRMEYDSFGMPKRNGRNSLPKQRPANTPARPAQVPPVLPVPDVLKDTPDVPSGLATFGSHRQVPLDTRPSPPFEFRQDFG